MHNLKELHMQITYRILQYAKGLGKGIMLRKNDKLLLKVYIETNYAMLVVYIRSIAYYYTFLEAS